MSEVGTCYGIDSDHSLCLSHTDHLGSTSYLTDTAGNVSQFVWYAPYGEALVDERQIKVRIESKPEVINRAYNVNPPIELNFSTLYGNDFIFKPDYKANRQLYKF